jgi:hypothetical protein
MKRNHLKLLFYGLGAMMIATSCLKTEELDSVKALRDAKTAKTNAETNAIKLDNAYDSANYLIQLATNKAYSDYQNANNEFTLYKSKMNFKIDSANAVYNSAINKANADYQVAYQKAYAEYQIAYQKAYADYQVAYYANQTSQNSASTNTYITEQQAHADYWVAYYASQASLAASQAAKEVALTKAYEAEQAYEKAKFEKQQAVLAATQATEIAYQEELLAQYQRDEQSYINQMQQSIIDAKVQLLNSQTQVYNNQIALNDAIVAAQKDSINNSLKNPLLVTLYNDYFAYYNGSASPLSTGVTIAANKGIFGLKQQILTDQDKLLTNASYKIAKENLVKTNANLKVTKLAAIRTDSLKVVADNELIAVYTNAKTAANYDASIAAINDLMTDAAADVTTKEMTKTDEKETLDELTNIYTIANTALTDANTAITTNTAAKNAAQAAMTALLGTYLFTTLDQLQTQQTNLTSTVNTNTQQVAAWQTQYNLANSDLATKTTARNNALRDRDVAQAAYDASVANNDPPATQSSLLTDLTNKTTTYNTAQAAWVLSDNEYTAVLTGLNTAKTTLTASQTALQDVIDDIADYNLDLAEYNKAVGKEAALTADRDAKKTDMETKLAAKDAQKIISDAAALAYTNALSTYNTYAGGKVALEALKSTGDAPTKDLSALDNEIFALQQDIENQNNDIADIRLQIARINDGSFKIDDDIALLTEQVAYNEALVADYEAKATAVKAQIDALE